MARAISSAEMQYQKSQRDRQRHWERYMSQTNPSIETPAYDEYLAAQGGIEAARGYQKDWNLQATANRRLALEEQKAADEREAAAFQGKLSTAAAVGYAGKEMGFFKPVLQPAIKGSPKEVAAAYNAGTPEWAGGGVDTAVEAAAPEAVTGAEAGATGATTLAGTTPTATTLAPAEMFAEEAAAGTMTTPAESFAVAPAAEGSMGLGMSSLAVGGSIFLGATVGGMFGKGRGAKLGSALGGAIAGAMAMTMTTAGAEIAAYLGLGAAAGPVGFIIGAAVGLISSASVVCTELYRQGYITKRQLQLCEIYRRKYVDDELYEGYLVWGGVVVRWLECGGWRKKIVLPLALIFTEQMINVVKGRKGSWKHRAVGFMAYRLSRLMYALSPRRVEEVA